jgi:hypothetical protein
MRQAVAFNENIVKPAMSFGWSHQPIGCFRQVAIFKDCKPGGADAHAGTIGRFKIETGEIHKMAVTESEIARRTRRLPQKRKMNSSSASICVICGQRAFLLFFTFECCLFWRFILSLLCFFAAIRVYAANTIRGRLISYPAFRKIGCEEAHAQWIGGFKIDAGHIHGSEHAPFPAAEQRN